MSTSKIKQNELREKIKSLPGLDDEEKARLLELLSEQKRYGLVWEDHAEDVEEELRTKLPVLTEVKERQIISDDSDAPNHILIEGDNLHALNALAYTHKESIDVIYIDPPYNTGNKDFIYNDSFVDSEDGYRHSKWLSFMSKRLRIAKRLLSDRGVIFISIDDHEQANLELLCNDIFEEGSFYGDISWQRSYSPRNDSKGISNEKEHILVYSRNASWIPNELPRQEKSNAKYKSPDKDPRLWRSSDAFAPDGAAHQGMVYAIQHPITGELIYPYKGAHWPLKQSDMLTAMSEWAEYELKDIEDAEKRAEVCGIPTEEVRVGVLSIMLSNPSDETFSKSQKRYDEGCWPRFFFSNKGKGGIARKTYLDQAKGRVVTNLWMHEEVGHTDEAKKEIAKIFDGEKRFDTPKPTRLLKRIEQISTDKNSIILDFFAGSGTTLHATMLLNAEDGGHRRCILITNNENNICENVTYERNKRVIYGYTTPKGEKVEGLKNNNLRYYKTDFVDRERTPKNMRQLMSLSTDLLCIKEDLYTKQDSFGSLYKNDKIYHYYADGKKQMLVIFKEEYIELFVEQIKEMEVKEPIKVYLFSPSRNAFTDEFIEVEDKVKCIALPAAIYDAYQRVLPKYKDPLLEKVKTEPEANSDNQLTLVF